MATQEVALEEGLAPLAGWVKRLVDGVIQDRMGHPDLEFVWSDARSTNPKDQAVVLDTYVKSGIYAPNEARGVLGLPPVAGGDEPVFVTPHGPVPLRGAAAGQIGSSAPD
jgi:hypothetical protein